MWTKKVGMAGKCQPSLKRLPPTDAAFQENVKRANLQIWLWEHVLESAVTPDVWEDHGWTVHEGHLQM